MISQRKPNLDEATHHSRSTSTCTSSTINNSHNNVIVTKPAVVVRGGPSGIDSDIEKQESDDSLEKYCENKCDKNTRRKSIKLFIGVCGIYTTYLYYGTLQEDVYTYPMFHYVWFVQVLEVFTNVMTAFIGRRLTADNNYSLGSTTASGSDTNKTKVRGISQYLFVLCGASQICSKSMTSMSLNSGLSYPIATLAKSSGMAPVMIGQLLLGNSKYSTREYIQVMCIILGTAVLGLSSTHEDSNSTQRSSSTSLGINLILLSLFMDGITGGIQKRIKEEGKASGTNVKGFEFMLYTNLYMLVVAVAVAIANEDMVNGLEFGMNHPDLLRLIFVFSVFGAAGQSFIFFTIANFDPLVCSTVTTTRKIFSVLLSIWYKGHILNHQGWSGIMLAFIGIVSELQHKFHLARVNEGKVLKG